MKVLSSCIKDIPRSGLKDPEKRFRARHLDLLVNPESARILRTRTQILKFIREFLDDRGFMEVETPILSAMAGGANAKPFETHAHALDMDMQLRIAPELYLKQLVIGGMDRVYEIGKQFRNEGIDADHNPEFTTCEFYQAYGTLEGLMSDTETLLSEMAKKVLCPDTDIVSRNGDLIDFKKPFRRINVLERLESELGTSMAFLNEDGNTHTSRKKKEVVSLTHLHRCSTDPLDQLISICTKRGIILSGPLTPTRILDKLISDLIEPECIQPTFLYNPPLALSPLAKDIIDDNVNIFYVDF